MRRFASLLILLLSAFAQAQWTTTTIAQAPPPPPPPPPPPGMYRAVLPQYWAKPHEADFPASGVVKKYIHANNSGDYPCSIGGLQASINDWVSSPVGEWREVIIDDGLSMTTGGRCSIAVGSTPMELRAKLGATGWLWIHSAHPTAVGRNPCNNMTGPDPAVDQRTPNCPLGTPHMWYLSGGPNQTYGNIIRMGSVDSAGYGPSHIRVSGVEVDDKTANYQHFPVWLITRNQQIYEYQQACSHIGFDYSYIHADYNDVGISAGPVLISSFIRQGCARSWLNWNYGDKIASRNFEGKVISTTDAPPDAGDMIVGNWWEGGAITYMMGGGCSFMGCDAIASDLEIRKNVFTRNPNWVKNGKGPGTACSNGITIKNNLEFKLGVRALIDGNLLQWVNDCSQAGQLITMTVRSCSAGTPCNAYETKIEDLTITNNIFRHAGNLGQTDGRSSSSSGGISVSWPGRRWDYINNLGYDIAPGLASHTGATPSYFWQTAGTTGGDIRWRCSAVRDSQGVVTLDCTDWVYQTIRSVGIASTSTQANGTTACSTCNIVTVNFTPTLAAAPYGNGAQVSLQNATGANSNGTKTVCGTPTACPANGSSFFHFRCGSPNNQDGESACPTWTSGGTIVRIGQLRTNQSPGDPTVVAACTDSTFNTPGSETSNPTGIAAVPTLAGTDPTTLFVKYQSTPGAPGTSADCTFSNLQGWFSDSIVSHNTNVGQSALPASFRNPHPRGGTAANFFPYEKDMLIQDNMDILDPAVASGGAGLLCCVQQEGLTSQRAGYDWATTTFDHQTLAGRGGQAANYSEINPTCFAAGNCLRGNSPDSTLWFPSLGPCPGSTVTTSGSGWQSGVSATCPGFKGMMNGVPFLLDTTGDPLVDYALQPYATVGSGEGNTCTANCGSPYAAGGPREASDHTDMGADMNRIRHAMSRTIYDECSASKGTCGAGPNPE